MNNKLDVWNITGIILALLFVSSAIMAMTVLGILDYFLALTLKIKIPDI